MRPHRASSSPKSPACTLAWTLLVLALPLGGCDGTGVVIYDGGAGEVDAGEPDAGDSRDAGTPAPDAGEPDAGAPADAGLADAGETPDAGDTLDAGPVDAGTPDAGPPDPVCGDGAVDPGEECDDGNTVPGDGCGPDCLVESLCPPEAPDCAAATPTVTEHHMASIEPCAFVLAEPTDLAVNHALIDDLVARAGGARTLGTILGQLNRQGVVGVSADTADRLKNHPHTGFQWNAGDVAVDYWYPQGITGSSDARASGRVDGRRTFLVSWYHKTTDRPTKGARVSLADFTDPARAPYRHLLLVQPRRDASGVTFGPAQYDSGDALHVGGIVWVGDRLYVADTAVGLRVFDMSRIFEVTNTDDTSRIGVDGTRIDAHGYRYAVPQLARYRLASDSCPVRFSFVSLDRSSDPPTLVNGEYRSDDPGGRLVRWPLDLATGRLTSVQGRVYAVDAVVGGQTRMQGGLMWQGNWYLSCSSQYLQYGRLYRTRPGLESRITAWPAGCEDIYYERDTGRVWTATEHPGARDVVGIPLLTP